MTKLKQYSRPEKRSWRDVLVLGASKKNQATIRRYYSAWRHEHGLPLRCDNPACPFHSCPPAGPSAQLYLLQNSIELPILPS